ncbi:hypothetical protein WME99_38695 [Sorangium sp. So ce136]|uniref:hypothetical protein n=1 Tax=Sorangium sp. So ce136 TaxID=3133284 RepID=UPI003F065E8C
MNASIHRMHVTLGSLALLALASGCGGERRPAQPIGRTPTFESEVPYDIEEQPPADAPGRAPAPGSGENGSSPTEEGRTRQGTADDVDERELCQQISASTSVSAEDIPGGVQIVMTPTPGASATSLETLARQLESHLDTLERAGQQPPNDVVARCRLFDMARTGARGRVVEAADGLRVLYTSPDSAGVSTLREQARRFVEYAREGQVR